MTAGNIFKMEFFKNLRDRVWLIIIGVLAVVALVTTIFGISMAQLAKNSDTASVASEAFIVIIFVTLIIFFALATYAFVIAYPYHLLSQDYSNRVLGLMVASGVNRLTYYFIKVLTTILSLLMALAVIFILPIILILGIYFQLITQALGSMATGLSLGIALLYLFALVLGQFASIALMFWSVIMARGKFWAIFVYIGIGMGVGIIVSILSSSVTVVTLQSGTMLSLASVILSIILAIIELVVYGLVGVLTLKNQDL